MIILISGCAVKHLYASYSTIHDRSSTIILGIRSQDLVADHVFNDPCSASTSSTSLSPGCLQLYPTLKDLVQVMPLLSLLLAVPYAPGFSALILPLGLVSVRVEPINFGKVRRSRIRRVGMHAQMIAAFISIVDQVPTGI